MSTKKIDTPVAISTYSAPILRFPDLGEVVGSRAETSIIQKGLGVSCGAERFQLPKLEQFEQPNK